MDSSWLHQCCPAPPTQWLLFHTFSLCFGFTSMLLFWVSVCSSVGRLLRAKREGKEIILGASLARENVTERKNKFVTWCLNFLRVRRVFCPWLGWFAGVSSLSECSSQSVISRLSISSYSLPLQEKRRGRGDFLVCFFGLLLLLLTQHHFQAAETFYLREEGSGIHDPTLGECRSGASHQRCAGESGAPAHLGSVCKGVPAAAHLLLGGQGTAQALQHLWA